MPTISGLPQLSLTDVQDFIQYVIQYLEIPSIQVVQQSFQVASRDILTASKSSYALVSLTSRPFIILLSLISRYILQCLKVISQHTFYHGIIAAKEAWRQICFGAKWFIAYQKSLPPAALWMEAGCILLLIGLFLLRRYIQKKKYVERVQRWYRGKKNKIVMRYERFVHQVAQTSMVLALLLPHVIYVILMSLAKWFMPTVVDYFANKTILADLISFYIPLIRTMLVIYKWRSFGFDLGSPVDKPLDNDSTTKDKLDDKGETSVNKQDSKKSGFMSMFRRKKVSDDYENNVVRKRSSSTVKATTGTSSNKKTKAATSIIRTRLNDDQKQVGEEISQLLQYWIVYFLLLAIVKTCILLPVVGRMLSNMNKSNSSTNTRTTSTWGKRAKKLSWLEKVKPSAEFFNECQLFFFIWLKLLPTSLTKGAVSSNADENKNTSAKTNVKSRIAALEKNKKKTTSSVQVPFSNRPIDILYERLSPALMALEASTSHLIDNVGKDSDSEKQSLVIRGVNWCRTFLDVMVWTKLISEKFQRRIIATLLECSDLLPAVVTFLMPSYFTNYGIIYIQLIVPSAHSVNSRNIYESRPKSTSNTDLVIMIGRAVRYLQYWVIQCFLASIFSSFAPVLAWVPLSTHIIFLVWAYVQLESTSNNLYDVIESELVAFGILKSYKKKDSAGSDGDGDGQAKTMDVNNTVTMRLLKSIAKKVPSAGSSSSSLGGKIADSEVQKENINTSEEIATSTENDMNETETNMEAEVSSNISNKEDADNGGDSREIKDTASTSNGANENDNLASVEADREDGNENDSGTSNNNTDAREKESSKSDGDSDSYIHVDESEHADSEIAK